MNTSDSLDLSTTPDVSVVIPVFNDIEWVEGALRSCSAQTLKTIEIIVVDDASSDGTPDLVEQYQTVDGRVRLIRQPTNQSAFQARRVGVEAARGRFILFLDGDDELAADAAASALELAVNESADVVAFGCVVIAPDGSSGSRYEREMQPKYRHLDGAQIVERLFPVGETAQGQLWRYLFKRELVAGAYDLLPKDLVLPRVNDLPLAFLALACASHYVSTPRALYRYFFRRGASGHAVATLDDYLFTASAIDSVEAIREVVTSIAADRDGGEVLLAAYEGIYRSVIGRVLHYVKGTTDTELRETSLRLLGERAGWAKLVESAADYCAEALPLLSATSALQPVAPSKPGHVLLRTGNLRTGGVQGVLVAQAKYLIECGYKVTIAVDSPVTTRFAIPAEVDVLQITGNSLGERISHFASICEERAVDAVIDHHIFYNDRWPYFALAANAMRVATFAWIHNFALRPVLDGSDRLAFLQQYLSILSTVVVLSEVDVAFWNSRGIERVVYIPNPPSPLLDQLPEIVSTRIAPHPVVELAWWGRLQQSTKQVRELVKIARSLKEMGVDFRLTVIGPDSPDLTATQLHQLAIENGVDDNLLTPGSLHGSELIDALKRAHVFVSTSVIEGYPLVLVEAQALGLPIVMYELPWLAFLEGNEGVVSVKQGNHRAAAAAIANFARDPEAYEAYSRRALEAARCAVSHDFHELYSRLLAGSLHTSISPAARAECMTVLLDQSLRFTEILLGREQRALKRARAQLRDQKHNRKTTGQGVGSSGSSDVATRYRSARSLPPSVKSSGFKGWLQNFLPATMRQAGFYARHQYSLEIAQHRQVESEFDAIDDRLRKIEKAIRGLQPIVNSRGDRTG